ncbi:MAG: PQQ-dependent sugar dehydrogenase [Gammaproteobacteria bacterium]|nr:PQQ-dependent sugar dehydrogenase [Gammaproteobacteria bacterium]
MMWREVMTRYSAFLLMAAAAGACQGQAGLPPKVNDRAVLETVATGLEHPWSLAFLPDGRMLVTERPGRLRYVTMKGDVSEPISGVPAVYAEGQGGLLDVALDPDFSGNSMIYLAYAERGDGDVNGTAVARAKLDGARLTDLKVIFRQSPKVKSKHHFGSRLVFARDGNLFVTLGERNSERQSAQDLGTHLGKIVRITKDGTVPADNPFAGRAGALPEIWSLGHRNVQGATIDPATGRFWAVEHGPRGGDEVNLPEAGRNYGWPVITYGTEYSGPAIGEGTAKAGLEQPLYYWVPSIATSGMTFYTGDVHPEWKGSLFVGALAAELVARLEFGADGKVTAEERFPVGERVRDIRQGPDGALYLVTDEDAGRLLRLTPAK